MLIAITQRQSAEHDGCDVLESSYTHYFSELGMRLIALPNQSDLIAGYFADLPIAGIVLTGGGTISPLLYGGKTTNSETYFSKRDEMEQVLISLAIERHIPVLGICRGMQRLNVFFGGTLIQNLQKDFSGAIDHAETTHRIHIADTTIEQSLGTSEIVVNSHHRMGISRDSLSPQLLPFAYGEDQTIEGVYHPTYPIAGIIWHPERLPQSHALNTLLMQQFLSRQGFWSK